MQHSSQFEPLELNNDPKEGKVMMAAAQANSVKSYENSPFEQTNVDHDSKVIGREIDADED